MAALISTVQIKGTITAGIGDNAQAEVGTFTLPLTVSTELHQPSAGMVISTGMNKLTRAMLAFQAVIDEE